jgi:exonuclease VII small subunit
MFVTESSERGVQLKEQIEGDVNQAVQEIQDLIENNTR